MAGLGESACPSRGRRQQLQLHLAALEGCVRLVPTCIVPWLHAAPAGEIGEEYEERRGADRPVDDLMALVDQIVPYDMTHNAGGARRLAGRLCGSCSGQLSRACFTAPAHAGAFCSIPRHPWRPAAQRPCSPQGVPPAPACLAELTLAYLAPRGRAPPLHPPHPHTHTHTYTAPAPAEPEAVDLLLEVERIPLLEEHADDKNYARTCLYLLGALRQRTCSLACSSPRRPGPAGPEAVVRGIRTRQRLYACRQRRLLEAAASWVLREMGSPRCPTLPDLQPQPYAPIAGCHSYLPEPDDATVLRTAFNIYSKVGTALQLQSCFAREKLSVWGFLGGPTRPLQLCVIA